MFKHLRTKHCVINYCTEILSKCKWCHLDSLIKIFPCGGIWLPRSPLIGVLSSSRGGGVLEDLEDTVRWLTSPSSTNTRCSRTRGHRLSTDWPSTPAEQLSTLPVRRPPSWVTLTTLSGVRGPLPATNQKQNLLHQTLRDLPAQLNVSTMTKCINNVIHTFLIISIT